MTEMYPCFSTRKTPYEIGSYFDIDPADIEKKEDVGEDFGEKETLYLSTCRSAIDLILKSISKRGGTALLPAFTCHAVVEPFVENGFPFSHIRSTKTSQQTLPIWKNLFSALIRMSYYSMIISGLTPTKN